MIDAAQRISRARSRLLLDHPWFGALSLRLQLIEDASIDTLGTDGTTLHYAPKFIGEQSDQALEGLLAHEVMHCALGHPWRCAGRDMSDWNIACDQAINPRLISSGLTLPRWAEDPRWAGRDLAAEAIYAIIAADKRKQPQPGQQPGGPQTGPGKLSPAKAPTQPGQQPGQPDPQPQPGQSMTQTDWQIAAAQATMVARRAGKMPGDLERDIRAARQPQTDWRAILRQFVDATLPTSTSWCNPDRRFIHRGIYLPGPMRESTPRLGLAIDTSGSIDEELLGHFAAELATIVHEVRPESIDVVYCDTRVQGTQTIGPDDDIVLTPRGGGGTSFAPVFAHFQEDPPAGVLYFTDLYGPACQDPGYPVLWIVPEECDQQPPFGELVRVSMLS